MPTFIKGKHFFYEQIQVATFCTNCGANLDGSEFYARAVPIYHCKKCQVNTKAREVPLYFWSEEIVNANSN